MLDPAKWVDEYGDYLFRYALSRLRDRETAEEVLQETLVAALKARDQYSGKGHERAWLLGILKRKIIDLVRKRSRMKPESDFEDDIETLLFNSDGSWKSPPGMFSSSPESAVERQEFWQALRSCLDGLPARQRDVFALREIEGMKSEAICRDLEISPNNLWVLLHRARLALASCLAVNFGEGLA